MIRADLSWFCSLLWPSGWSELESLLPDRIAIRECGGGGHCLYYCVAVHLFGVEAMLEGSRLEARSPIFQPTPAHAMHARLLRHLVVDLLEDDEKLTQIFEAIANMLGSDASVLPDENQSQLDAWKKQIAPDWDAYCQATRCSFTHHRGQAGALSHELVDCC